MTDQPQPDRSPPDNGTASKAAVAYVRKALQMNPLFQSDEIISLRSRRLNLNRDSAARAKRSDVDDRRSQAQQAIERVREHCWHAPPEHLSAQLDRLDLTDLPDVSRTVERLRVVIRNRPGLPAITGHKHFDGEFFSCLKQVLVKPSKRTNVLREQVLASFRAGKLRKRGRKMIKLIKRELPEIYALEADWFTALLRQQAVVKADPGGATNGVLSQKESQGGTPWWAWILGLLVLGRLVRALITGDNN